MDQTVAALVSLQASLPFLCFPVTVQTSVAHKSRANHVTVLKQGSNNRADDFIHFSYLCLVLIELTVELQYQNGKEYGVEFVFATTEIA